MSPEIEIPIIADSLSRDVEEDDRLARCVYFLVVADEMEVGMDVTAVVGSFPSVTVGAQTLLYRPLQGPAEFTAVEWIDSLINAVEGSDSKGPLTVETGYVWIPTHWLDEAYRRSANEGPQAGAERGNVFRVTLSLLRELFKLTDDRISMSDLKIQFSEGVVRSRRLRFSRSESTVFEDWAEKQF